MPDTVSPTRSMSDAHYAWASRFCGFDVRDGDAKSSPGGKAPGGGAPGAADEPSANQSVDPKAGEPADAGKQTAPDAGADPNANQSVDPNAVAPADAGTQAAPDAGADPNANQSVDPNAVAPADAGQQPEPAAGGDPNANRSVDPNTAAPAADPATPAAAGAAPAKNDIPEFTVSTEVPVAEADLEWVTGAGELKIAVVCRSVGSDAAAGAKFKNGQLQIETKVKEKLTESVALKGGTKVSDRKGSIEVGLEGDVGHGVKTSMNFEIVEKDAKKGTVNFASLRWDTEWSGDKTPLTVGDIALEYQAKFTVAIRFKPNWKTIGAYAAKQLGIAIGEDAALGVAAGGTGTAGAAAVAAAPVAGVLGGLVGGVGLAVGVCAGIGKLQDLGKDAMAVSQDGLRRLRAYAGSYGSTMRGKPGSDAAGNADAEAALKEIMGKTPGLTHEQAVQAAIDSRQNYEEIVFHRFLGDMREKVRAAYKEKEGRIGYFFSYDTLDQVLNTILGNHVTYL